MTVPLALGWVRAGVLLWPAFLPAADLDFSLAQERAVKMKMSHIPDLEYSMAFPALYLPALIAGKCQSHQ